MNVESRVVKLGKGSTRQEVDRDETKEWLRRLFVSNRDPVFRYALSRVDRHSALEIVAETFAEAASSRSNFDPRRGTEINWLLGIATNRINRWHRTESRYVELGDARLASMGGEDAELVRLPERIDDERRSAEIRRAVGSLPEGERAAFLLHANEGLSNAEVADVLRISTVAAKLRIFRARKRLQRSLDEPATERMRDENR